MLSLEDTPTNRRTLDFALADLMEASVRVASLLAPARRRIATLAVLNAAYGACFYFSDPARRDGNRALLRTLITELTT